MEPAPSNQPVVVVAPPRQTVWWVIAILLSIIATALIVRPANGPFSMPSALADSPMAGARGVFAFTGQIDVNRYGLFMMDVDTRHVWCYEYLPTTRRLHLVFARTFDFDRYLESYNLDESTSPEAIKKMIDESRKIKERKARNGQTPDDGDGSLSTSVPGMPSQEELDQPKTSTKP